MGNQRNLGIFLYCVGICIAVTGAAKMPMEGEMWSDVLYLFNDGAIVTLLGLVLWRQSIGQIKEDDNSETRSAFQLLRDVQPILDDLYRSVDDLECYQIQEYVKILREQYLVPLEVQRGTIIAKYGLEKAAELLVAISYGERIINRVHSAALDGYHDEAVECTEEAHAAFQEVFLMVRKLWGT